MTPADFKAFRYRHGLPQAVLAEALGVGRTMIVDVEQGRTKPSRLMLLALAAYAHGLEPYQGDPRDLKAFKSARPRRISRPQPLPALHLAEAR